mmetsp:Transcript_5258/g.8089  ORF Transcript_5258/g.8089 Transcript_5258/m.8089 type:complete len:202 (+) Transcript_5258:2611-3216(+)
MFEYIKPSTVLFELFLRTFNWSLDDRTCLRRLVVSTPVIAQLCGGTANVPKSISISLLVALELSATFRGNSTSSVTECKSRILTMLAAVVIGIPVLSSALSGLCGGDRVGSLCTSQSIKSALVLSSGRILYWALKVLSYPALTHVCLTSATSSIKCMCSMQSSRGGQIRETGRSGEGVVSGGYVVPSLNESTLCVDNSRID